MDIPSLSFRIFLIIIPFTLLILKLARKSATRKTTTKLPPGPWKLPIIGNMHQLAHGVPHQVLRDLAKKYGPLMHLKLGEVSTIVVSSPEIAKEVMKTHDINFASRPPLSSINVVTYGYTDIAFAPYGEYWRQLRKICILELLSAKRVQSFDSIREEEFSNLVSWIKCNEGSVINLTEKVISTTYSVISRAAFGKKSEEHEKFISLIGESSKLTEGFNIADVYPSIKFLHFISGIKAKLERLKLQEGRILEKIIQEHIVKRSSSVYDEEKYEDLVDVLLKYMGNEADFCLTTDNIKAVLVDIFGAGGETSAMTVDWAMCEMLKNPNILKKARDEVRRAFNSKGCVDATKFHELKYLKTIIKETLRLHPPLPLLLPREGAEACEINGFEIPAKTKVIVNAWAIGRDSRYWEDPECFKPERFLDNPTDYKGTNLEYIPFGAGRRICPGMLFGLANVELLLAKLLYHFEWTLPNGMNIMELSMVDSSGGITRRIDDLYVVPMVCNP